MNRPPWDWIEDDVLNLIGQPESSRLEFKRSDLLSKPKDEVSQDLGKEISAFANSEGGTLVIGIKERKEGRTRLADELDGGIDPKATSPEWLQQLIEGSISPHLPGIRVRTIPRSGEFRGRVAYVVFVPKGSTAYQASKQKLYYSRSEYESLPMADHDIRLRMSRGRTPQARVRWGTASVERRPLPDLDGEPDLATLKAVTGYYLGDFDDVARFELLVENTGEVTIRDYLVAIRFESNERARVVPPSGSYCNAGQEMRFLPDAGTKILPSDSVDVARGTWRLQLPRNWAATGVRARLLWTVYLDNAYPCRGELDATELFSSATEQGLV